MADEPADRLTRLARRALPSFGLSDRATCTMLHVSENATFAVEEPDGRRWALRLHRPRYQSLVNIESELSWMEALRAEAGVRTPRAVPALDGRRVIEVSHGSDGPSRRCVLFEWVPGFHPAENDAASFERLGEVTARMHEHSRRWPAPDGFSRFAWDLTAAFGPMPRWGRWRDGLGVGAAEEEILDRLEQTLTRRLRSYGSDPARFGLVHADTRLANLLVDGDEIVVIDFDDCGYSWFLYDLATAFSFFEDAPQVPELIERWLTGYRSVTPLGPDEQAEIWTFILFRRLLLVAWLGSHRTVDLAQRLGAGYTTGTCELAERYLRRAG